MNKFENIIYDHIASAVNKMTLSASGWRGIFNVEESEQSTSQLLSSEFAFISYFAAVSFSNFLYKNYPGIKEIVLARDARPTGENIEKIVYVAFEENRRKKEHPFEIRSIGIACIPEVISYAASRDAAFFYISASHNPIGYNGFKFGIGKYGVLEKEQAMQVVWNFKGILLFGKYGMCNDMTAEQVKNGYENTLLCESYRSKELFLFPLQISIDKALSVPIKKIELKKAKDESFRAYSDHIKIVVSEAISLNDANDFFNQLKHEISASSIYIVCDFNGSARTRSIDQCLLKQLGINFIAINDVAGEIVHEIIPEGKNLTFLSEKLEAVYQEKKGKGIFFGYMPDCDGDRGNIVYIDNTGKAQIIKSQEVFALATIAEILHAKLNIDAKKLAVVANGPTSLLIEEISEQFGFTVFRAEVGEANVVNLATAKRHEGYNVRILGEGSNGGCIIPPSLVRDPLCTIFSLLKFFVLKLNTSVEVASTFSQLMKILPHYETTPVAETRAILHTHIEHVKYFRENLQKIFLNEWKMRKLNLFEKYDVANYKVFSYIGTKTIEVTDDFSKETEGGLKIVFYDRQSKAVASIWMRQSGTEPVFRLMADIKNGTEEDEKTLVNWEKEMIENAKRGCCER